MDAFERYVTGGLELAQLEVDDVDLHIMRFADAVFGPAVRALERADLAAEWPEPDLDPSRPPHPA